MLIKEKEPSPMKINEIREVKELFLIRIEIEELNIKDIFNREFKIEADLYLKCFSLWERAEDYAVKLLFAE